MEELFVWSACRCVYQPEQSLISVHTKRVESMSSEMVGFVEGLFMKVHYYPGKANVVVDALGRMSTGITTHFKDG